MGPKVRFDVVGDVLGATSHAQSSGRLLTIGIPVFNGKGLLRNCLQSVINSTLQRDCFEVLVADDGSSEPETLAILREFECRFATEPGFFRVVRLGANSGGAARPRNRILDEAVGEYVFFLDSDDTIGDLALERIAEALAATPADWVALHQVPVNGRGGVCTVQKAQVEVTRAKALTTLTVHKVFRRAEIERQQLRFDEGLPSGQDVAFAFSYILNAKRFLMLGAYDYYFLIQHADNPTEPAHLSCSANTAQKRIVKNERILRSMLTALRKSNLPEAEQQEILSQVALPRVLLKQGYLKAVVAAGPRAGTRALRRLSAVLADPMIAGLDQRAFNLITPEHLAVIARSDWAGLVRLHGAPVRSSWVRVRLERWHRRAERWERRWHRLVDLVRDGRVAAAPRRAEPRQITTVSGGRHT